MPVQNHIHLYLQSEGLAHDTMKYGAAQIGDNPTTYGTVLRGTTVYVEATRSLTGYPHVHRLVDDLGALKVYCDSKVAILANNDNSEYDELKRINGQDCYFIPIEHPDDSDIVGHGNYAISVVPKIDNEKALDPMLQWWLVTVSLFDSRTS